MKKMIGVLLAVVLSILTVAGCGSKQADVPGETTSVGETVEKTESTGGQTESAESFTIGFDMFTNQCAYCLKLAECIEQYAQEAGMTVIITQADGDVTKQISNMESMATQGASVISGIFGNAETGGPVIELCESKDITLVATLTGLSNEADGYANYIYLGSENFDGGYLQGKWLAEHLPEDGNIWYLDGVANDQQSIDRRAGLEQALKDAGHSAKIIASEYCESRMDLGLNTMETWLQAYPNIDCVVSMSDPSLIGAIEAAKNFDRMDNTLWVGFDGQDIALESIEAGEMDITIFQDADGQAREFIEICKKIRDGADPSAIDDVNVPFKVINAENVGGFSW